VQRFASAFCAWWVFYIQISEKKMTKTPDHTDAIASSTQSPQSDRRSSPAVLKPLENLNSGKKYAGQIKPFNFLLACHVRQFGHPPGTDPEHFHLVAPYESDPRKWLHGDWIDQYSGKRYRITAAGHRGNRHTARVKTHGDVLREYEFHPESKCADWNANPCGKQTVGLLQRPHVQIELIKYIGKESNRLEDVVSSLSRERLHRIFQSTTR
jgi:hypothetical protein